MEKLHRADVRHIRLLQTTTSSVDIQGKAIRKYKHIGLLRDLENNHHVMITGLRKAKSISLY